MYQETTQSHAANYNPQFLKRVWAKRAKAQEEALRKRVKHLECQLKDRDYVIMTLRAEMKELAEKKDITEAEELVIAIRIGKIPVREIIRVVAAKNGVRPDDITGPSRQKQIKDARFEAIAQARRLRPELSLPQLGRQFGGRDHTTMLHALRKMGMPTAAVPAQ